MRVRTVLILTAIASSLIGGLVVYLVFTVPNDVSADALLKQARQHIAKGDNVKGRAALTKVVQQYPRTNAAAAAMAALVTIGDEERQKLDRQLEQLQKQSTDQKAQIDALTEQVTTIANTPPPAPKVIVEAPPKKAPAKKSVTPKRRTRRRRR